MKQIKYYLILIVFVCSCNKSEEKIINGEFMPNIRNTIDFETADASEIDSFIKRIDSIAIKNNDNSLKLSSKFYHDLLELNLIRTPSIYLKQNNDSLLQIFVEKSQFEKIKKYDYLGSDLKYKIDIKLRYKRVTDFILLSDSILEVRINNINN